MLSNDALPSVQQHLQGLLRSSTHQGAVECKGELLTADGRFAMKQRSATDVGVSRPLRPRSPGFRFRRLKPDQPITFWKKAADAIELDDSTIKIVSLTVRAPKVIRL